jgi:hypothetical protein
MIQRETPSYVITSPEREKKLLTLLMDEQTVIDTFDHYYFTRSIDKDAQ